MLQFMHIQLLSSSLEIILNQALTMGQSSPSAMAQLEQKSLAVELDELNAVLCLTLHNEKVLVTSPDASNTFDCKITTSLKTLVQLKNEQQLTQLIKDDQLDISGDIKIAQQYAALFESLNIDWPSELEKHIGDIATHKLISLSKEIKTKAQFAQRQIEQDASEYLVFEKKLVVTAHDINEFSRNVSDSAQQLDQLEQQFSHLSDKLKHLSDQGSKKG